MNKKAQSFSIEASIGLIILMLVFIFASGTQINEKNNDVLYITKLEHDLTKVWIIEKKFSINEMYKDFEFVFPNKRGYVQLNNEKIEKGVQEGDEISAGINFSHINPFLVFEEKEIKVSVFN